jgi:hypothetical protein
VFVSVLEVLPLGITLLKAIFSGCFFTNIRQIYGKNLEKQTKISKKKYWHRTLPEFSTSTLVATAFPVN